MLTRLRKKSFRVRFWQRTALPHNVARGHAPRFEIMKNATPAATVGVANLMFLPDRKQETAILKLGVRTACPVVSGAALSAA